MHTIRALTLIVGPEVLTIKNRNFFLYVFNTGISFDGLVSSLSVLFPKVIPQRDTHDNKSYLTKN